ncbi:hypothetical protein TL16_g04228 [Triparma laevis f. inornata]|uniref:Uncharacterized protein n=1 Tax=Triparma laevis f. inornata TaxID=1714386 RepID=A0A9W7A8V5_9STRA|nr:hypothetical protein TL16_g04228 [Triparma laevis f. inornata]
MATMSRDLAHFSNTLSSFTGNLESSTSNLLKDLKQNKAPKANDGSIFINSCNSQLTSIEEKAEQVESFLIGNPDEMSLGDLSELCSIMQESNTNTYSKIEMILRQYGFKNSNSAAVLPPPAAPVAAAPVVIEDDGEAEAEEEQAETIPVVIEDDEAGEEKEEQQEEQEEETKTEEDFVTPNKPGYTQNLAKETSPETPPTPTMEMIGISNVAKSVLKGGPNSSTKKLASLTAIHQRQQQQQTPKPMSVSERVANLRAQFSNAKSITSARKVSAVEKLEAQRSSISFAASTTFTPASAARRRKFVATPVSKNKSFVETECEPEPEEVMNSPQARVEPCHSPSPAPHSTPVPPPTVESAKSYRSDGSMPTPTMSPPTIELAVDIAAALQPVETNVNIAAAPKQTGETTPTFKSPTKTPAGKKTVDPPKPVDTSTPKVSHTPEGPKFSTCKKLHPSTAKKALEMQANTPNTPPTPEAPDTITKPKNLTFGEAVVGTPEPAPTCRSTTSSEFTSPDAPTPEAPTMKRSTVKKAPKSFVEEEKRKVIGTPEMMSSPPMPVMASAKKVVNSTPVVTAGSFVAGTPETSPCIDRSLAVSTIKKAKNIEHSETPPAAETPPTSTQSSPDLPTPPPLNLASAKKVPAPMVNFASPELSVSTPPLDAANLSLTLSNTKSILRNLSLSSTKSAVSSLGSPEVNTPSVVVRSSTKKARKNINPPNTPLLASASKKILDKRERHGREIEEEGGIVKGLFEAGEGDEESVATPVAPLACLKLVAQDEWDKAPRLVKMQAKLEPLNEAVQNFNAYFEENVNKEEVEEGIAMDMSGKRMILMGLAHFGRLVMGEKNGKKIYKAA